MSVNDLVNAMKQSGVMGAGRIAKATDILELMIKDKECKKFLGVAGAMVPGGMKDIIIDMLKNKYVDVLVTTGATLTHDLVEALGFNHFQGSPDADDKELHKKKLDRMYDSYMPGEVYKKIEDFIDTIFDSFPKHMTIKDFLWHLGKNIPNTNSILWTCYKEKIPLFCPAIADSGIGLIIWGKLSAGKSFDVNTFEDLKEIIDIAWTSKKNGVLYIGGGVPKNYIQQAMQIATEASYGVQITTDRPEFGGSSGANLREGISWGKMKYDASFIDVFLDATVAFPLIYAALKSRL